MKEFYKMSEMKPHVEDYAKKEDSYSQKYDQAPLSYVERQNRIMKQSADKLKGQDYKGRYSK